MQPNNSTTVLSETSIEDQALDGFVTELEQRIGVSLDGSDARKAQAISAKRLMQSEVLKRRFGKFRATVSKPPRNVDSMATTPSHRYAHAIEVPIPTVTKLFDEINFAGEMVGFGIGIFVRLTVVSMATILVVGFFSIFVFLHGVGQGIIKKHW
jgi:hypothetical protein